MTVQTATYPIAPAVVPHIGTLLGVAQVTDDFPWLSGEALFDSYNCMKFQSAANFCAPNSKTFDNTAGWVDGIRFNAYGGVVCKAVGLDIGRMKSEVGRVFEMGESTAVEKALMAQRFIANDATATVTGTWPAPTDITPAAGAVKPAVGVAMLEGYSAANYVGMPTLHLPTTIAGLLLGANGGVVEGPLIQTRLGSKVVSGAGYDFPNTGPTGAAAPTGEKWLYATGEVVVARSDLEVVQVMSQGTNEMFVLAERAYIAAVDCFAAAIRVTVNA